MDPRAKFLIDFLQLRPHPEGGYYREAFRSSRRVKPSGQSASRSAVTTIYFLLAAGQISRWHRVASDEIWHYYEGDPLELFCWERGKDSWEKHLLGPARGEERPVRVIPGGCWQAARPQGEYALTGCCVAPGFEFSEFALLADSPAEAALLRRNFPDLSVLI